MIPKNRIPISFLAISLLAAWSFAWGQTASGDPQAQAAYSAGEQAKAGGDPVAAADDFQRAITLDPRFLQAHIAYLDARLAALQADVVARRRPASDIHKEFDDRYKSYEKLLPDNPNLRPAARLAYAFSLDPETEGGSLAHTLSGTCTNSPDVKEYIIKAIDSPGLAPFRRLAYARALLASEPELCDRTLRGLAKQFPTETVGMQALIDLADAASSDAEKVALLERVRADFRRFAHHEAADLTNEHYFAPPSQYNRLMQGLFKTYLKTESPKAVHLAEEMVKANPEDGAWFTMLHFQKLITQDLNKMDTETRDFLEITGTQLAIWEARHWNWSGWLSAYEDLVRLVARNPVDPLKTQLYRVGTNLQKTPEQVDGDVLDWQKRTAKPFRNFELSTIDGKQVNLTDYRGKVVLITFWFPTCQGCLEEFPNFEKVLEQRRKTTDKFAILAVNILPEQDALVAPLFQRMKLDFPALKVPSENWEQDNYGVGGGPWNYLLDPDGRLVYATFYAGTPEELSEFESRVDWLLSHRAPGPPPSK